MGMNKESIERNGSEIAVIGMAGRFPGANDIGEFWENLKFGRESISFFNEKEIIQKGVSPNVYKTPGFVRTNGGIIDDKEFFDASFFGFSPAEGYIIDPQVRIFLECVWESLENASYDPNRFNGAIGLYSGASSDAYWEALTVISGLSKNSGLMENFLNNKDFISTHIAYKLNLTGPIFSIQTACSTSLVAVHLACQGLLNGECDIALAGGVNISSRENAGYLYQEGFILSPDGHCRAFDSNAKGTVGGNGVGVVVLKMLDDAIQDKDFIYSVIKGTAINNDGTRKVGYSAPSIEGQAEVIKIAQQVAEVEPHSISYIETHGTATVLGDPVEIEGLKLAFKDETPLNKKFCAIGSVKSNIGHLDAAAGIAGFIKTSLALKNRLIPPSLHFESPNPRIDFDNSPFFVNTTLKLWENNGYPLRAGVSSFGIGGSNAHVILEEAPEHEAESSSRHYQLLLFSAKTEPALVQLNKKIAEYLRAYPTIDLADAAYTMTVGRKKFQHRQMVVASSTTEVIEILSDENTSMKRSYFGQPDIQTIVFMFPGQGAQYVNMGLDLYEKEAVFRREMDNCLEKLSDHMGFDIKEILYPGTSDHDQPGNRSDDTVSESHHEKINQTAIAQPLLFTLEYSLAKLLMHWGVKPDALIGHSIGEYVAACLANVITLEDALALVSLRGKLMQEMPPGSMISVGLSIESLKPFLNEDLSLAAINGPSNCVVAGNKNVIADFEKLLIKKDIVHTRLHTSHAFHSQMMDPILHNFKLGFKKVQLSEPQIPIISNLTGDWLRNDQAVDPEYWVQHLRNTVQFSSGIEELLKKDHSLFLELGPGNVLSKLFKQHQQNSNSNCKAINLIRHPREKKADDYYLMDKIGMLWLYGVNVNWNHYHEGEKRYRIPLPSFPFTRQRYWPEQEILLEMEKKVFSGDFDTDNQKDISHWFYIPSWKRSLRVINDVEEKNKNSNWLIFTNESELCSKIVEDLVRQGNKVQLVERGDSFSQKENHPFVINPYQEDSYDLLFNAILKQNQIPDKILHFWSLDHPGDGKPLDLKKIDEALEIGFFSLISIAKAIGKVEIENRIDLKVISNNMRDISGGEGYCPEKATLLGPIKVIPVEFPNIQCCSIDIDIKDFTDNDDWGKIYLHNFWEELLVPIEEQEISLRNRHRWVPIYEPIQFPGSPSKKSIQLTERGVYLITGGLGGIGLILAEFLAKNFNAHLILIGRSDFPIEEKWDECLLNGENNELCKKIRKLYELKKYGAEILVLQADVSDQMQMESVISLGVKKFGKINGVIHCAGTADGEMIQRRQKENTKEMLTAKIHGSIVLDHILSDRSIDFIIYCSSITSILGGIGQVGYCAANNFLDAYANYKLNCRLSETKYITINWDNLKNFGITDTNENFQQQLGAEDYELDSIGSKTFEVFNKILLSSFPQVIISSKDLNGSQKNLKKSVSSNESSKKDKNKLVKQKNFKRPEIGTPFVAPRNEIEKKIEKIWSEYFGYDEIGIYDDFYELGGDSLKATAMLTRIKNELNISVSLIDLFNNPKIEELARHIFEIDSVAPKDDRLVLLKKGSNEQDNIFFIHDISGDVEAYIDCCKSISSTFNCWGIRYNQPSCIAPKNITIEEVAFKYIDVINQIQSDGPYYFFGWSMGGIIAFEIAQKLEEMNKKVEFLCLIDSPGPNVEWNDLSDKFTLESEIELILPIISNDKIKKELKNATDIDHFWEIINYHLKIDFLGKEFLLESIPEEWQQYIPKFDQQESNNIIQYSNLIRSLLRAKSCYIPKDEIKSTVHFFRASESPDSLLKSWQNYIGSNVKYFDIQGNHFSILKSSEFLNTISEFFS